MNNDDVYDPDDGDLDNSPPNDSESVIDDPDLQGISDDDDYSDLTKLPDEDSPRSDPDDIAKTLDDTHPATDTNIDSAEEYDEGLSGAAEAEDPLR
jgi:hypothetical protein